MRVLAPSLFWLAIVCWPVASARAADGPGPYLKRPDPWFATEEARAIAEAILSHQSASGGWPKNLDTTRPLAIGKVAGPATFDNGATTDELRFLARVAQATGRERERVAFLKGLRHVLDAQYANGGWPQSSPPGSGYARHITFNDNAMVCLMDFVREVGRDDRYDFVDAPLREASYAAFERGVECILKCQVRVDGQRTVWCAQHDAIDFKPRPARSYELVSLSGAESVGIVRLLMSLDRPSDEVVEAIESAVDWFRKVAIEGRRQTTREDPMAPGGRDKVIVADPKAPPLWARFYEIGTNRPFFADRDGTKKYRLDEIGHERRNGYAWLGDWPAGLVYREYPAWRALRTLRDDLETKRPG